MSTAAPATLLLNLPNQRVITRRYMCSYNSPMSLFPPYELLSLGGIVRDWKHQPVVLVDAIAERLDRQGVLRRISEIRPGLIVTIAGFECFGEDMDEVAAIKRAYPALPLVLFGHYPTIFPLEVMQNTAVDYILLGEPDVNFSQLYDAIAGTDDIENVSGLAYRAGGQIRIRNDQKRIATVDSLPSPAFELAPLDKYSEPAMPRPFGMIQSARGCPYGCNYCVRSFGRRLTMKSPARVLDEIRLLKQHQGIRSLRFIDDTFTIDRERVIEICKRMIEDRTDLQWTCLSRTDNLDAELLREMKSAGCRRIYFGLESGSQRILDRYDKGLRKDEARETLLLCRRHRIETSGFFMMGLPFETEEDFAETLEFARSSKLTYAMIAPLTLYPGTELYESYADQVNFSLFPYENSLKDRALVKRWGRWERRFYRSFYFSPTYLARNIGIAARSPLSMLRFAGDAFRFAVVGGRRNANPFTNLGSPEPNQAAHP